MAEGEITDILRYANKVFVGINMSHFIVFFSVLVGYLLLIPTVLVVLVLSLDHPKDAEEKQTYNIERIFQQILNNA